jgi:hypothetical protein
MDLDRAGTFALRASAHAACHGLIVGFSLPPDGKVVHGALRLGWDLLRKEIL